MGEPDQPQRRYQRHVPAHTVQVTAEHEGPQRSWLGWAALA